MVVDLLEREIQRPARQDKSAVHDDQRRLGREQIILFEPIQIIEIRKIGADHMDDHHAHALVLEGRGDRHFRDQTRERRIAAADVQHRVEPPLDQIGKPLFEPRLDVFRIDRRRLKRLPVEERHIVRRVHLVRVPDFEGRAMAAQILRERIEERRLADPLAADHDHQDRLAVIVERFEGHSTVSFLDPQDCSGPEFDLSSSARSAASASSA